MIRTLEQHNAAVSAAVSEKIERVRKGQSAAAKDAKANREAWLKQAAVLLGKEFITRTAESANPVKDIPALAVCAGFPSQGALARKRRIGECWPRGASNDGLNHLFISPLLDDPVRVLGVLAHEMAHAIDDCKNKHKKPFKVLADAILLEGKVTATTEGEAFKREIAAPILAKLGPYPHSGINASKLDKSAKQGTRMLKCQCPECGYTVRTTRQWLEMAIPKCPIDEVEMECE